MAVFRHPATDVRNPVCGPLFFPLFAFFQFKLRPLYEG